MNQEELIISYWSSRRPLARACNEDKAHFGLRAYLVDLQERGRPTAGIAERVAAALAAPVDWDAVEQAVLAARARKRDDR